MRVWFNGVRLRKASVRHGDETVFLAGIPVRRLCCGDCVWRWSLAPEGIVSPAHYQPCVVAPAVAADVLEEGVSEGQVARACGCARRTVGRWVRRVAKLAEPGALARHLAQLVHDLLARTALHQRHRAHAVTGLAQGNGFGELAQLLLREGFELLDQLEVRWVVRRAGLERGANGVAIPLRFIDQAVELGHHHRLVLRQL